MKKLLISLASIPLTSLILVGQQNASGPQSAWSGLLVAASCHAQTSMTGVQPSNATEAAVPSKTAGSTREQNATYEQTQNQVDRPRDTKVRDEMARTTDRGTLVAQAQVDSLARTTTPPIDDEGSRGKATINNTAANDAANRAEGRHDADRGAPGKSTGTDGDIVKRMAPNCRIGQSTSAFALRLADGSLLKFDDASNTKIAQQLQSGDRVQHKTKIFRAKVKGSLQDGTISADSIQM